MNCHTIVLALPSSLLLANQVADHRLSWLYLDRFGVFEVDVRLNLVLIGSVL